MKQRHTLTGLFILGVLVVAGSMWWDSLTLRSPLLLAPMMDLTPCLLARPTSASSTQPDWISTCTGPESSAAPLVESTLHYLQPKAPKNPVLQLGYTLQVPLLALLQPVNNVWQVNKQAIDTIVRTVRDNPRPLVLYLFSTHFGVNAPIEPILAQNSDNIAQTPKGPLPVDRYYSLPIYPWSVARTDNSITHYRVQVIHSLLQSICTLPRSDRIRIQGITLLGEVHQLFPNFESGMGFNDAYQVSDYSASSIVGFRRYLQSRYANLESFNQQLGSDYVSFEEVVPPAKNIRSDPLRRYQEHIDAFAAGIIPITGWVHAPDTPSTDQTVKIYLNGKHIADAPVHLSRQDVRAAHPEFNTADLGWRHDIDYSKLPPGIHRIDLALSQPGQALMHLGTRSISIMDKNQKTPKAIPTAIMPSMQLLPTHIAYYVDEPRDQADYYYNPLAREWQTYRELQVVQYLQYFNNIIAQSCLSDVPRYTHQIVPQFNPGWDSGKYAVNSSLMPQPNLQMGVSLYGETSYGKSFFDWHKKSGNASYGITEFHPLQSMSPQQLGTLFQLHHENGARFLSFFLETRWQERTVSTMPNLFSFDPGNHQHESNQLYTSMENLLGK